jgi:multidrug efflux system outer membrane protein
MLRVAALLAVTAGAASAQQPVMLQAGGASGSSRAFFDSLAAKRGSATDTPLLLAAQGGGALAWVDLLQDSALVALVREAVSNSPDIQIAQARIREFRAEAGVTGAARYPQLSANGVAATQQTVFGSFGTQSFDAFRATADLTWELDFWGRLRNSARGASFDAAAKVEEERATLLSLVSDVATTYLELREIDQELAVAERTLTSRRATMALAERRLAEGVISELDVRQFEAEVAAPAARVAQFTRDRARKEHQLSLLVGRVPGPIARGRPLSEVARAVTVPDSISSERIAQRPDILRAQLEVNAAEAKAGSARAARLPKFLLTGQYGTQAGEPSQMFKSSSEIYTVQGGISIPLFTGGRVTNERAAAEARSEQATLRFQKTVLTAQREVSDALVGVRTSRDQVLAQEVQARALRRAQELAEKRYDAGIASYLEVLDAQRGLFNAELALSAAEREYLVSAVTLYKALGGNWK